MRTTVDIPEPLLRKAKTKAALEGKKLEDVVTEALEDLLTAAGNLEDDRSSLPANMRLHECGLFRIPVLQSSRPGQVQISPKMVKDFELNEEVANYKKTRS